MNWIRRTENHFSNNGGYKVSHVRTDNGGEFINHVLHDFFNERGITHELTVPYSSSQNGAVERAHGVLQTKVRSLLIGGRVPPYLWSEALLCAAYLHNRTPITGKKRKIPYLYWNNKPRDWIRLDQLRVFGCAAYVTIPPALRDGKLLPTSILGVMVGYDSNRKAYRIYLPSQKKVITAKDVQFDETTFPLADSKESHEAYDFATGILSGAPKYPQPDYNCSPDNGETSCLNDTSSSYFPSSPLSSNTTSSLSSGTASDTKMSSSSHNDNSKDPDYYPSDISEAPQGTSHDSSVSHNSASITPVLEEHDGGDVPMPDYIPDQADHIEDNTQKLLKLVNTLVERQNDTSEQLQKLMAQNKDLHRNLESYQSVTGTELEQLANTVHTIKQRSVESATSHLSKAAESTSPGPAEITTPTTPQTPIVEFPDSSPPPELNSPPREICASEDVPVSSSETSMVPYNVPLPPVSLATEGEHSSNDDDVILIPRPDSSLTGSSEAHISNYHINSHAVKRLHSTLTSSGVSPARGALIINPGRHTSEDSPPPDPKRKRTSFRCLENSKDSEDVALLSTFAYAIGNNPIPIFGLENTIIPFGDRINDQVYALHLKDDSSILTTHSAATALLTHTYDDKLPKTIKQAKKRPDRSLWKEACSREISALIKTKTFELVKPPLNRKVIPSKWVFTIKDNGLYKARVVVQGFRQVEGIDYQATFAPVIRYGSVRMFLALSVQHGLRIRQMDVVTAFLNSPIDTDIYVKPPPGFDLKPGYIWKLNSALYGLKQSPMLWNNHIKRTLSKIGFKQNKKEFGLYFRKNKFGLCLIALYVDDLLIASSSEDEINSIKNYLKKVYEMKDLGPVNKFLGMNIKQTSENVTVTLADYIEKKAKEYDFSDMYQTYNPLQKHIDYYGESPDFQDITLYQSLVGTLIFIANSVRLDIAHAVHFLSRFLKNPKEIHYKAAHRVFSYVYTTRKLGIVYSKSKENRIVAYSDASYADCPDRRSTFGYVCMYASGPVTWCSKRISSVVTSSTEAEIIAASEAAKEIKWLDQVLKLMGKKSKPHLLHMDNTSSLKLADHPIHHSNTKHIEVRNLYVREANEKGLLNPVYVSTKEQLADIFTKILTKEQFLKLVSKLLTNSEFEIKQSTD